MKQLLLLFMIFPLCLMFFNNTAFRHRHILPDGQVIEHAHPFQSAPDKSGPGHQHSEREIILFTVISDSPVVLMFFAFIPAVYRARENDFTSHQSGASLPVHPVPYQLLRAPPFNNNTV